MNPDLLSKTYLQHIQPMLRLHGTIYVSRPEYGGPGVEFYYYNPPQGPHAILRSSMTTEEQLKIIQGVMLK